jgi:hypothetical protein
LTIQTSTVFVGFTQKGPSNYGLFLALSHIDGFTASIDLVQCFIDAGKMIVLTLR